MTALRRLAYATLGVAYLHLVFGAIVRITGSGMGCGDHWPKCQGAWFPPFDQPTLVIEYSHRTLAALLIVTILALLGAALRRRNEAGVGGRGGVLRAASWAAGLVVVTAGFGAITVFLGNPTWATVVHWTLAMSLVAVLVAAVIRAGGFGGASASIAGTSARTFRSARGAAAMAFITVVMGGLTAKFPTANVACLQFPLCGLNPGALPGASHIQMTHRVLAFLLFFHLIGMIFAVRKRREVGVIARATWLAFGAVLLQLLVAGAMIGMRLPTPLRSLHEAVGVLIWVATFGLAYLAALGVRREESGVALPAGSALPASAPNAQRPTPTAP